MSHRITLFLASSSELKAERSAFELRVNRINKAWHADGLFLDLQIWEDFIDAVSPTRLQDEYNQAIRAADLFVLLVHTKVGRYSREEFETALAQFRSARKPLIYTYFKNPPEPHQPDPGPDYASVRELRSHLDGLGHFPTAYESAAELLDHFTGQLEKLRRRGAFPAAASAPAAAGSQATVIGSGAVAQGPHAQAAGAGGVAIGGNHRGTVVAGGVHTGGGAFVGGNLHVAGNFIGRDHVEPGRSEPDRKPADLALLVAALRPWVSRLPTSGDAALAGEHLAALQAEADCPGATRNAAFVHRLLEGLADLMPEAAATIRPHIGR